MEMEKKSSLLRRFIVFMENDTENAKIVSYGIASVGLIIALYRVRPFTKIKKPSDLPSLFLRKRVPLQGTVVRIEPSSGTLLMVDHEPLIPRPQFGAPKYLPVKVSGLNVTTHGISWLQSVVSGNGITFVPLAKKKEYLDCIVAVNRQNQGNLKIGEELVKLGFATVEQIPKELEADKEVLAYRKSLEKLQKYAEDKRNGYWHFARRPTPLWRIKQKLNEKMKGVLPAFLTQHLDV